MKSNLQSLLIPAFAILLFSETAFAASANFCADPNVEGVQGLCTQHDVGQPWVDEEWCKTIYDQITGRNSEDKCASDLFAEVSQKIKYTYTSTSMSGNNFKGLGEYCPNIASILKSTPDQDAFIAGLLQQVMATLAIAESSWDPQAGGIVLPDSGKSAKGLFQLEAGSVGADIYKCGCSEVTSDQQLMADPKLSAKCATHIAMYYWNEDAEIGSGTDERNLNKPGTARGAAAYFQPFRDIDKEKRERYQKKVAAYCDSFESNPPAGAEGGTGTTDGGQQFYNPGTGPAVPESYF